MPSDNSFTPSDKYQELIKRGALQPDPGQAEVVARLDALHDALKQRGVSGSFKKKALPRGLYIHGDVGRGKSALMDLFYENAPEKRKRRVHFHAFMQEVHERIHTYRQQLRQGRVRGDDPIPPVAAALAKSARLLCFDEFQVRDIADASILGRLFEALFAAGVIVVATSNRSPDDLYLGGLNRHRFLPFIDLLKNRVDVLHLDSPKDYRLDRLKGHPVWFKPCGPAARGEMDAAFKRMTGGAQIARATVSVKGRDVIIPRSAQGVARFEFSELCEANLGAGDYLELARTFHTLFIDDIPVLSPERRNEAVRFANLVDALYEHRVKLLASAEADPAALCPEGDAAFEFRRTASRLQEMQSDAYFGLGHNSES